LRLRQRSLRNFRNPLSRFPQQQIHPLLRSSDPCAGAKTIAKGAGVCASTKRLRLQILTVAAATNGFAEVN
jgi:hypothetical protein